MRVDWRRMVGWMGGRHFQRKDGRGRRMTEQEEPCKVFLGLSIAGDGWFVDFS